MKGVILAGGLNTRLYPLTRGIPKCLLPVHNKTMVDCAIETLQTFGIDEVLIITDKAYTGNFVSHLGIGKNHNLKKLAFLTAPSHWETPRAMCQAEEFLEGAAFCLLFGDNIFTHKIKDQASIYLKQRSGSARIILSRVSDPREYGIAVTEKDKIKKIVEKPGNWDREYTGPISNLAVTGCYFYPGNVFKIIPTLKPTIRADLTISDLNNYFVSKNQLKYGIVPGWWWDTGESIEKYQQVCRVVTEVGINNDW